MHLRGTLRKSAETCAGTSVRDHPSKSMRAATLLAPGSCAVRDVPVPATRARRGARARWRGAASAPPISPPGAGSRGFSIPLRPASWATRATAPSTRSARACAAADRGARRPALLSRLCRVRRRARRRRSCACPLALEPAPFPGEPLGCAMNIFARSGIKAGDTVAIVGIGFLGALLTELAVGCRRPRDGPRPPAVRPGKSPASWARRRPSRWTITSA